MQKFSGKENKNMKRQDGVPAACDTFFLYVLHVDFGYIVVLNPTLKVYPWPSIVLLRCGSASFTKAH